MIEDQRLRNIIGTNGDIGNPMSVFKYTGKYPGGEPVSGALSAPGPDELKARLLKRSIILETCEESLSAIDLWRLRYVASKEVTRATRQLATLLSSGLTITEALESQLEEDSSTRLMIVFRRLLRGIREGERFSASLASFPQIFDQSYTSLVEAGESVGKLPEIMLRLADHRERMETLKRKFYSAMVYPSLVVVISVVVLIAVFKFVIPVFSDMYASFGAQMPQLTQDVVKVSEILQDNFLLLIALGIVTIIGAPILSRIPRVRLILHRIGLNVPLLGGLWKKIALARFARTLGLLQSSGADLLAAVDVSVRVTGNAHFESKLQSVRKSLEQGDSLRNSLSETNMFPAALLRMVGSGEKTGKLGQMLTNGATYYEKELEDQLSALSSVIEPLIILMLGLIVGFIIVVMYLPLFDLINQIGP